MKIKALISELDSFTYESEFDYYIEDFEIMIYDHRKEYKNYNHEIIEKILNATNNIDYLKDDFYNLNDFINYYGLQKENNKKYSNKEKSILIKSLKNLYENDFKNSDIITILNIIKNNKNWDYKRLTGYCQGESTILYYNTESVKNNDIDIIESLFFGGCYEVLFTNNRYLRKIENIFECESNRFLIPNCYNIIDVKNHIIDFYKKNYKKDININDIELYNRKEKQIMKSYYEKI